MLTYSKFRIQHVAAMNLQDKQAWVSDYVRAEDLKPFEKERSYTVFEDGQPLLCCGSYPLSETRAFVWGLLSNRVNSRIFREVHTLAKQFIASIPFRRLETTVDAEFTPAHRWMKSLGFELEAPRMRAYELDGRDAALYAKVNHV